MPNCPAKFILVIGAINMGNLLCLSPQMYVFLDRGPRSAIAQPAVNDAMDEMLGLGKSL